jgi:hypothetical protein
MYIQCGWSPGRIGRVRFSKTERTLYYRELVLESLGGGGYKVNHFDVETLEKYWISGPRQDGQDTLYPGLVEIDVDVLIEYWRDIRRQPQVRDSRFRSLGVHGNHATR